MNLRVLIIVALLFCLSLSARAQTNPDQNHVPTEEQIAKYKRLTELLKHPTFITLRLASARRDSTNEEPSTTPSPYASNQWMNFELFITQNSTENLVLTSSTGDIYQQNRLILIRDGEIVPYRRDVQRQVETAGRDIPYGSARSKTLEPGREYRFGLFALDSWYESPLKPGHYQLTIRRQFAFDGDWVESNSVTFDVVSPKQEESIPLIAATTASNPTQEEVIAANKRRFEQLKHPTFITLRLASQRRDSPREESSTTPSPYVVGELISFQLFITQSLFEELMLGNYMSPSREYRPELYKDGAPLSYTKEAQDKVDIAEHHPASGSVMMVQLVPGREVKWTNICAVQSSIES